MPESSQKSPKPVPFAQAALQLESRTQHDIVALLELEQPGNILGLVRKIRVQRDEEVVSGGLGVPQGSEMGASYAFLAFPSPQFQVGMGPHELAHDAA